MRAARFANMLFYYSPLALLAIAWDLSSRFNLIAPELAPSLAATLAALWTLIASGELTEHAGVSIYRESIGFLSSVAIGTMIGIGMARIEWVRILLRPCVTFLYPMPKSALIPILLLWFGLGHMSKIAAVFLGCLLPMVTSSYNGARGVEPQLIWSARNLGMSERRVLWKIVIPAALPQIISGLQIAFPMALVVTVVTEMITSGGGLGGYMMRSARFALSEQVFAGIVTIGILGYLLLKLFDRGRRHLLRWHAESTMAR